MQKPDNTQIKKLYSQYPTGVTIVTALDADKRPSGMTANSFASVSLSPPLISWCIDEQANLFDVFVSARHFAVHILRADQSALSNTFASKGVDRFSGVDWCAGIEGIPVIRDCAASMECALEAVHPAGDHKIIVGAVKNMTIKDEVQESLAYHQGCYKALINL